ncbi:transcriptional regulatory protein [Spirochaeta thermophila DSM 6192]|uniref:Transcriptional regulatory protein n=1 Tax=Winmispira thermophila (strain ATCC 49972 / DSM 6192 / RI 19.B1) TaxID=665571 RepID=E0RTS0_WINT6|nr:transcriptional regulatory protein [Spirochaeta thermophila DSM 6192]
MSRRPTIYDVARKAGVSISTVSRVVNSPSRVRPSTREKVRAAIAELGFEPAADAAARARKHLRRVGVLTPFFTEASFVQRIRGVSDVLGPENFEVIIYTVKSETHLEEYLELLSMGGRVDALVSLSLMMEGPLLERLIDLRVPVVSVESALPGCSSVLIDNREGGRLAASYLLSKGYRRFSFIGEFSRQRFTLDATEQRLEGFLSRLEEEGIPRTSVRVAMCEFEEHTIQDQVEEFVAHHAVGEAVFASSDIVAARLLSAARNRGIGVPGELAILGFDDLDMAGYLGLSTISQALDQSGMIAARILLSHLENSELPAQKVFLELSVVERSTT